MFSVGDELRISQNSVAFQAILPINYNIVKNCDEINHLLYLLNVKWLNSKAPTEMISLLNIFQYGVLY